MSTRAWDSAAVREAVGTRCPRCNKELNAIVVADPALRGKVAPSPRPGDITVCAFCGSPLVFGADLTRRELSLDEYRALPHEERVAVAAAIQQVLKVASGR